MDAKLAARPADDDLVMVLFCGEGLPRHEGLMRTAKSKLLMVVLRRRAGYHDLPVATVLILHFEWILLRVRNGFAFGDRKIGLGDASYLQSGIRPAPARALLVNVDRLPRICCSNKGQWRVKGEMFSQPKVNGSQLPGVDQHREVKKPSRSKDSQSICSWATIRKCGAALTTIPRLSGCRTATENVPLNRMSG